MSDKTLFCRCEDVTLAEVEHAFGEGHRDIESLKRYTGFATGWCQGKQCLVACARFLADKTGHLPEAPVTPRPPIHPMPLGLLAGLPIAGEGEGVNPSSVRPEQATARNERGGVEGRSADTTGRGRGDGR